MMKKLFILLFFFCSNVLALPQTIDTYLAENRSWRSEPASQNYLSIRCAILNHMASERLGEQSRGKYASLKEIYDSSTMMFSMIADYSQKVARISTAATQQRVETWGKIYADELIYNWNTYNSAFHGDVADDLMTCNKTVLPGFLDYIDSVTKR